MFTYKQAAETFSKARNPDAGYCLSGRHTRLIKTERGYGVRYVNTVVVEILPGDRYVLNTGGWYTSTTKERISTYGPVSVYSHKNIWYLSGRLDRAPKATPFSDGMVVDKRGHVLKAPNAKAPAKRGKGLSMRFIIKDWAGNIMFNGREFESFDDAWECVYEYLRTLNLSEKDYEEYCGEYYVYELAR